MLKEMIKMHENNVKHVQIDINNTIKEHEMNFNSLKEMYDNQLKDGDDKCKILEKNIIRADVMTNL